MHHKKETTEKILENKENYDCQLKEQIKQYFSMCYILDVIHDENKCRLLLRRVQENMNNFSKTGITIYKKFFWKKQTDIFSMFNCLLNN